MCVCGGVPLKKKRPGNRWIYTPLKIKAFTVGKNLACCCGIYEMVRIFYVCARARLPERQNNDSYCTQYTVNSSTHCEEEAAQLCNQGLFSYSVKKKKKKGMRLWRKLISC